MRKLTIKREKSFVGSIGILKIYIQDNENFDLVISGDNCRMLGEIKNGEEKTFEIENVATKIYAIADKSSRDYCNDLYQLDEGEEDIFLSGKCKFNPAAANAFHFNGNNGNESTANRKKSVTKGAFVLIGAMVFGLLAGYFGMNLILGSGSNKPKEFQVDNMSITLTKDFDQINKSGYRTAFVSRDVSVLVSEDSISASGSILSHFTSEEYAKYIMELNNVEGEVKTDGDLVGFSFSGEDSKGDKYQYYAYVYTHDNVHWMIQFAVRANQAGKYADKIEGFAKSVTFK